MLFVIIISAHLYDMFRALRMYAKDNMAIGSSNSKYKLSIELRIWDYARCIFFSKEGWEIKNMGYPILLGMLLGPFFLP